MLEQMLLPNMDKYKKENRPQKHIYGTHMESNKQSSLFFFPI